VAITESVGGEKGGLQIGGFRPCPKELMYWQHAHSADNDFMYVTRQTLTPHLLRGLLHKARCVPQFDAQENP